MNTNQNEENKPSQRGLKNRHIQLIAIAGTIGTGLFLGAGKSIHLTGPSIIYVYSPKSYRGDALPRSQSTFLFKFCVTLSR